MKAIGYTQAGPIDGPDSLETIEISIPETGPKDLLVAVKGVSVNPVDAKVRAAMGPEQGHKVIGYDAAGIVQAVGSEVSHFKVGDEVYYAGDLTRSGTNAELHLVDERIAGKKPKSLDFAEAAALPLTAITAWELLFDSLGLKEGDGQGDALLIIGAAGGVGSIGIQLARQLTKLEVIATASRPETIAWVQKMGAHHAINHRKPLAAQVEELGLKPKYVISLNGTGSHFPAIVDLIAPRGHIAIIDDPAELDMKAIKMKALSFSWEFMFTRSMFQTTDMDAQRQLLNRVAALVDEGILQSTMTQHLGEITVENLIEAHKQQESGKVIGKNVLGPFPA